ncbi:hypothetical protein FOC1_g10014624 [Fusarium oxysporum f. sp. cubense race 1]|nr:hypothetical protein FOC1_g10014624 [Fusarium oxysporum f. sp. cubense race 1]
MFDCAHTSELAVPLCGGEVKIPTGFLLQSKTNGRVPSNCRRCIIQGHLDRWTIEARLIAG